MLGILQAHGSVRTLDVELAELLCQGNRDEVFYLILLLLDAQQKQHSCLALEEVNWENPFSLPDDAAMLSPFVCRSTAEQALLDHPAVGDHRPLKLFAGKLYFARMDEYEALLAARLSVLARRKLEVNEARLGELLGHYFPKAQGIDWQKAACALAASSALCVLTGGPGTGKTTTVTKLLAILQSLYENAPLTIRLVAPTGKAAARLSESILGAKEKLGLEPGLKALIPDGAQTIHRLLGVIPHSNRFRHHKDNPLHLDLLVVDEASMVDLALMAKLVEALPERARLILLGDKDQLASVDTGSVLGDVCRQLTLGETPPYSEARADSLSRLCGFVPPLQGRPSDFALADCMAYLQHSYRFDESSGIGQLARAVNTGDAEALGKVQRAGHADLSFYGLDQHNYQGLIERAADHYRGYLKLLSDGAEAAAVHRAFMQYQLLAAVREGPYGVAELNQRIEHALMRRGLIRIQGRYYPGMPLMISQNDYQLKLFNGDIGIVMRDADGELKAVFVDEKGEQRAFFPARLPAHDKVYVMTIHKSQGSEFPHTAMILPPLYRAGAGINRQLVYTGITRAKEHFELVADGKVLLRAMSQTVSRASGLYERLT